MPGILGMNDSEMDENDAKEQESAEAVDLESYAKEIQGNVPEQMRGAYTSIVVAGMKFLFSDETQGMIDEYLAGPEPIAKKLGEGISALMVMITKEAKGAMTPELVIPSGIELIIQSAKYVNDSGTDKVGAGELGQAIEIYIYDVLSKFGVSQQQFDGFLDKHGQQEGAGQEQAMPQEAPQEMMGEQNG